jgi:spore maturation protein SpmB
MSEEVVRVKSTATASKVENVSKKTVVEIFLSGCTKGFKIGVELIIPAMILGYTIVQFFQLTGLMNMMGIVFKPVMAIFGLPGEGVVVLISAFFAKASGCATAAMMYANGTLSLAQATILFPACILMGTLVGHYARIVLVTKVNRKWHALLLAIPIVDAALSMIITRIVLKITGLA